MRLGGINSGEDLMNIIQFSKQYVAVADKIITNTTAETSMLSETYKGAGKTITTSLKEGSVIRFRVGGIITTPLLLPGTLTFRVKLNGTVIGTVSFTSLLGNLGTTNANGYFSLVCSIAIRKEGAAGIVAPVGAIEMGGGDLSLLKSSFEQSASATAVDLTMPMTIDLTAQWGTASTSRNLKITGATINIES